MRATAPWQPPSPDHLTYSQPQLPNQCHFKGHRRSSQDLWSWGCHSTCGWLWSWKQGCVWGSTHWLCQEPFSEAAALLLCHSGLCPPWTMGLLCLMAAFLPSSPREGAISTPMVLFPSCLPRVSLFLYLPRQQGKVVGSELDRRKTNKYSINKKKKIKTVHQIPA